MAENGGGGEVNIDETGQVNNKGFTGEAITRMWHLMLKVGSESREIGAHGEPQKKKKKTSGEGKNKAT